MADAPYSHANQKPGWRCTRGEHAEGPCALVPTLYPNRGSHIAGHRYMGPPEICNSPHGIEGSQGGACWGTGLRIECRTKDGVELSDYDEVYCECPAGGKRMEIETGRKREETET